jgi:outer membrane protein assembly factor BamD
MNLRSSALLLLTLCLVLVPFRSPAPLVYRPGEGWTYEPVGGEGKWQRPRAKEQLEVAQAAFDNKDYSLALKAALRVSSVWPLSDYAPQAQYLAGRCYEAKGKDEKAFKSYQKILDTNPKITNYDEILQRQYEITGKFLAGKSFKLWGVIPIGSSMSRTAEMYEKIVRNGPYSEIAPEAQLKVGAAWEKKKTLWFKTPDYPQAARAYERAADRYFDRPKYASDALYLEGLAMEKQARKAEYDQGTAGRAIAVMTDFITLYPNDERVPQAQRAITALRTEQARGSYQVAKFYEKYKRWAGAMLYYNEVLLQDPESQYGNEARQRIDALKAKIEGTKPTGTNAPSSKPDTAKTEDKKK